MVSGAGNDQANSLVGQFAEKQHEARYGKLDPEHQVSVWVNEFFQQNFGKKDGAEDIEVIINDNWKQVNALASLSGNISLSRGLLDFIDSEEELRFVLGHEFKHLQEGHLARINAAGGEIGVARYLEYRADQGSLLDVEEGENPYGGIIFLKKLSHQKNESATVHGSSLDRLLNVFWSTKIIDIAGLEYATTDLPGFVSKYASKGYQKNVVESFDIKDMDQFLRSRNYLEDFTLHQLIAINTSLITQYHAVKNASPSSNKIEFIEEVLEDISKIIPKKISLSGMSNSDSKLLSGIIQAATCAVDITADNYGEHDLTNGFFDEFDNPVETMDRIISIIDSDKLSELSIAGTKIDLTVKLVESLAADISEDDYFIDESFNSTRHFEYSERVSNAFSSIFISYSQEEVKDQIMAKFFVAGLYNFRTSDPKLKEYSDQFKSKISKMQYQICIESAGKSYHHLKPKLAEGRGDLLELLSDVIPPPADLSYRDHEDGEKRSLHRKQTEIHTNWLKRRRRKINRYVNSFAGDKKQIYQRLREHMLGDEIPLIDGQNLREYRITIGLITKIVSGLTGKSTIENISDQILTYRAVFPYGVPPSLAGNIDDVIERESNKPKSKNYQRTLFEIQEAMTSDDKLIEKYPFVK